MSGDLDRSRECGGCVRQRYYGSFREFAIVMKKLQKGQTVMFHKPYPSGGNPVAFYLGRLARKGLLNRRSFPAHTEFRLKDGQKLTHDIRGVI
ncbi:hypothetical protein QRX32_22265 [Escherichia coli]|nr:hypothetical protein [Escherichia coli]MCJ8406451.1 hypothetical protein [Escherichia coli]MEC3811000.1 hypothetical protein [Escherichia coli]MEC3819426.1 hypothetical protein [Escherichia coli]